MFSSIYNLIVISNTFNIKYIYKNYTLLVIMRFHYLTSNIITTKIMLMTTIVLMIFNTNTIAYSTPQPNADSLIFEDPEIGVKFEYPNDWVREDSFLYGPESECSSLPCNRLPQVLVSKDPTVYEGFSLEDYMNQQKLYHEYAEGYQPIALNETKIGGKNAFHYVYSTKSPFIMENEEIINHEIDTTEGINLYKITFTALLNEQYDNYLKSFKKMIDTFEIIS
jgi:hypothetical protein